MLPKFLIIAAFLACALAAPFKRRCPFPIVISYQSHRYPTRINRPLTFHLPARQDTQGPGVTLESPELEDPGVSLSNIPNLDRLVRRHLTCDKQKSIIKCIQEKFKVRDDPCSGNSEGAECMPIASSEVTVFPVGGSPPGKKDKRQGIIV